MEGRKPPRKDRDPKDPRKRSAAAEPEPEEKEESPSQRLTRQSAQSITKKPKEASKPIQQQESLPTTAMKVRSKDVQEETKEKEQRTSRQRVINDTEDSSPSNTPLVQKQKSSLKGRPKAHAPLESSSFTQKTKQQKLNVLTNVSTDQKIGSSSQIKKHHKSKAQSSSALLRKKKVPAKKAHKKHESDSSSDDDTSEQRFAPKAAAQDHSSEEMEIDQTEELMSAAQEKEKDNVDLRKQCDLSKLILPLTKPKSIALMSKRASDDYENYTYVQEDGNARPVCHACFQKPKLPSCITMGSNPVDPLLQSVQWLYTLAYCMSCCQSERKPMPVHLNCLGYNADILNEDKIEEKQVPFRSLDFKFDYCAKNGEVFVKKAKILVYKCEVCRGKLTKPPECMVCLKTEGFMKRLDNISSDSPTGKKIFVHQICALSHPEHFQVADPYQMSFHLKDQDKFDEDVLQQNANQNIKKPKTCTVSACRMTGGLRKECHHNFRTIRGITGDKKNKMTKQICEVQAHAFCAFQQYNDLWWKNCEDCKNKGQYIAIKPGWSFQAPGEYDLQRNEEIKSLKSQLIFWCMMHSTNHMSCYGCTDSDIYRFGSETTRSLIDEKEMVQCDFCTQWYHQLCDVITEEKIKNPQIKYKNEGEMVLQLQHMIQPSDYAEGKSYVCHKCRFWNDTIFQGPMAKGLFVKELDHANKLDHLMAKKEVPASFQLWIGEDKDSWRHSWLVSNEVWLTEHNITEQIMMAKLWNFLRKVLSKSQVTENLRNKHCSYQGSTILNLEGHEKKLQEETDRLKSEIKPVNEEIKGVDAQIADPLMVKNVKQALMQNNKNLAKLEDFLKPSMIISPGKNDLVHQQIIKHKVARQSYAFYEQRKSKEDLPKPSDIEELINSLKKVDQDPDQFQFKAFTALKNDLQDYLDWQKDLLSFFQLNLPSKSTVLAKRLRNLRQQDRGIALMQKRYAELKLVFDKKNTYEFVKDQIEAANQLKVDTQKEVSRLNGMVKDIQKIEKQSWTIAITKDQRKPLQKIRTLLVELASQPVKPTSTDQLLQVWLHSARWHSLAKSFVLDRTQENKIHNERYKKSSPAKPLSDSDQEWAAHNDKHGSNQTMLKIHSIFREDATDLAKNLVFERSTIQSCLLDPIKKLVCRDEEPPQSVFFDADLAKEVRDKADMIFKLVDGLPELLAEKHEPPELQKYIEACKDIDNYDFSREIDHATKKLDWIVEATAVIYQQKGQYLAAPKGIEKPKASPAKQAATLSQDQLAMRLLERMRTLQKNEENPINFPQDVEFLLEAKVQISESLRAEFSFILETKMADTFNKQMISDLRKIEKKATKEHGLQMNKEKQIIDNLEHSEEWFVETFAKLKNICGQSLHQIDFKNYQQLHSVLKTPINCEILLKETGRSSFENLVGAAKNLHMSLLGAQWLFDVRFLLDSKAPKQDLSQLLQLYRRAQDLNIDVDIDADNKPITLCDAEDEDTPMPQVAATGLASSIKEEVDLHGMLQQNNKVINEFRYLARIAHKFDELFGSHSRIILTLEQYESAMNELLEIVEQLEKQLVQIKLNKLVEDSDKASLLTHAISTATEMATLNKVRTYISLNSNYQTFLSGKVTGQEMEHDQSKPLKISYLEAIKLQKQAKTDQIPEDIPVLKRLNQSIQQFEKFKRQSDEYSKFRHYQQEQQRKPTALTANDGSDKQQQRRFSVQFVNKLLATSQVLDIEIREDIFDRDSTLADLGRYKTWRKETQRTLADLEDEINAHKERDIMSVSSDSEEQDSNEDRRSRSEMDQDSSSGASQNSQSLNPDAKKKEEIKEKQQESSSEPTERDQVSPTSLSKFIEAKQAMSRLPVYDAEMFQKIQAFDWLINANQLLSKKNKVNNQKKREVQAEDFVHKGLNYWQKMLSAHDKFLEVLPLLNEHPIIQKILWEIDQAEKVTDFVKQQKGQIKSLQGKLLNYEKNWNYDIFRNKNHYTKIEQLYDICLRSRVDLNEETHMLHEWFATYEDYVEMAYESKNIFTENTYEKLKQIQRTIYLSPVDFGDLYLQVSKRLDIANQIKHDIKSVTNEIETKNKKIVSAAQQQSAGNSLLSAAATDHSAILGVSTGKRITTPMLCGGNPLARVKFSRVKCDINHFVHNCQVPGVPDIDDLVVKITESRTKLRRIAKMLKNVVHENIDEKWSPPDDSDEEMSEEPSLRQLSSKERLAILREARSLYQSVDIDMGEEELGIRVAMWKAAVKLILERSLLLDNNDSIKRVIDFDQFKVLHQEYCKLKRLTKNDQSLSAQDTLITEYVQLRKDVASMASMLRKCQNKDELGQLTKTGKEDLWMIVDFSQIVSDRSAEFALETRSTAKNSSSSEVDQLMTVDVVSDDEDSDSSDISYSRDSLDSSSSGTSSSDDDEEGEDEQEERDEGEDSISSDGKSDIAESSQSEKMINTTSLAHGRDKRKIKPKMMDDHIYFEKKDMPQLAKRKRKKSAEEIERLQNKRERKTAEKRFKRRIEKDNRARQERKKAEELNSLDFGLTTAPQQDRQVRSNIDQMKARLRTVSKKQLTDIITIIFKRCVLKGDPAVVANDIEGLIFEKNQSVDATYRKRIADTCSNMRFFAISTAKQSLSDMAESLFVKKSLKISTLFQTQPVFREYIEKIVAKRKQMHSRIPQRHHNLEDNAKKQLAPIEVEVVNPKSPTRPKGKESPGSVESLSSQGPAQFSDDDTGMMGKPYKRQPSNLKMGRQQSFDPIFAAPSSSNFGKLTNAVQPDSFNFMSTLFHLPQGYNPRDVVVTSKAISLAPFSLDHSQIASQKQNNAILYDPTRKNQDIEEENVAKVSRNFARPGAILKVWEGMFDLGPLDSFNGQMYSTGDIQQFQMLPELAFTLPLKGKAKQQEVIQHFGKLKAEKQKILSGWIVRKNMNSQDNSDRYCRQFEQMEQSGRVSVFQIVQGVSMYIVPMVDNNTKLFCKKMGVWPLKLRQQGDQVSHELDVEEETHYFAFFCQMRHTFPHKQSFLNPQVLTHAVIADDIKPSRKKQNYSPITSDDEADKEKEKDKEKDKDIEEFGASSTSQIITRNVKQEPVTVTNLIKEAPEVQEVVGDEVDQLISRLRASDVTDYQVIKSALEPIIPKIDGHQHQMDKLDAFIKEVIARMNSKNTPVKKEEIDITQGPQMVGIRPPAPHAFGQNVMQQQYTGGPFPVHPNMPHNYMGRPPAPHNFYQAQQQRMVQSGTGIRPPAPPLPQYQMGPMYPQPTPAPHSLPPELPRGPPRMLGQPPLPNQQQQPNDQRNPQQHQNNYYQYQR